MKGPQITTLHFTRHAAFEEVDAKILVSFAFSVPQYRSFYRLNFIGIDCVDLTFTIKFLTGKKELPRLAKL